MEYVIKIKSKNTNLILIDKIIKNKIEKNGFLTLKCNLNENESFIIEVEPLEHENTILLPYKIFVKAQNNKLNIESTSIDVLNYKNTYIINLINLEATKNMLILENNKNYSIFNTSCTNIALQNFCINLPEYFTSVNSKIINQNNVLMFENKQKKYVVILNNNKIIFNDYYNKINLENTIEILSYVYDIAKHAILTKIENTNKTQKVVYYKTEPIKTKCTQLIPHAFLQALKLNNIKLCHYYLDTNLKDRASLELLKSYFGDFKKIEYDNNNYILFYPDKSYKIFEFFITNNKITKINSI